MKQDLDAGQSAGLTVKELAGFKANLQGRVAELEDALIGRGVIAIDSQPDLFDQIQLATERDLAIGYLERESTRLREVKAALGRFETGAYGICTGCEEPISRKRLVALPWAPMCIACRELADRNQPQNADAAIEDGLLVAD